MAMDLPAYRAFRVRQLMQNNEQYSDEDMIYEIIKAAEDEVKREEIVGTVKKRCDVDDEAAGVIVDGAIGKLLKDGKVVRNATGVYQAR